jgi:endogenous inhibitor of DNA gyrase (YacG/DUF329 family)
LMSDSRMKSRESASQRDPIAMKCSSCGRRFYLDETTSPPFCSERCKLIDLGRWLDEEVSVPHEGGPTNGEAVEHDADQDEADEHENH